MTIDRQGLMERVSRRVRISPTLLGQVGWTTSSYMIVQGLRFAQNLVLTHILAPELFGVMIVLTSLRVGVELFTDIGIGQNIVASREAWEPRYYNTAWTLQLIRGVVIGALFLLLTPLLGRFYDNATLNDVFPVLCVLFVMTGAHSVGPSLAVKAIDTRRIAYYETASAILGAILTIAIVLFSPTAWGLIAGNVAATLATAVLSYFVWPGVRYRLMLDGRHVREIIGFGKWIFVSSIIFFLATNFDRLILGKYVSLAMLGVYGVARSLSDIFGQFATRLGNAIVFPSVAAAGLDRDALRARLRLHRRRYLTLSLLAVGGFIAVADPIVSRIYDHRYAAAGPIAAWLGLAAWVLVLNTFSDSVLLGLHKPKVGALGNVGKFVALLVALPLATATLGIIGAAIATVLAEVLRYVILTLAQVRERIHFLRQDVTATAAMLLVAVAVRAVVAALGLSARLASLFQLSV